MPCPWSRVGLFVRAAIRKTLVIDSPAQFKKYSVTPGIFISLHDGLIRIPVFLSGGLPCKRILGPARLFWSCRCRRYGFLFDAANVVTSPCELSSHIPDLGCHLQAVAVISTCATAGLRILTAQ